MPLKYVKLVADAPLPDPRFGSDRVRAALAVLRGLVEGARESRAWEAEREALEFLANLVVKLRVTGWGLEE